MRQRKPRNEGQALVELSLVTVLLMVLLLGIIDFSRFILQRQVVVNLTREGANLASRGTTLSNAVDAVVISASPLNIASNGRVIITSVLNSNMHKPITGVNVPAMMSRWICA